MVEPDVQAEKQSIRHNIQALRKTLPESLYASYSQDIYLRLRHLSAIQQANVVHVFLGSEEKREVKTRVILNWLFHQKKRVLVPVIQNSNLISVEVTSQTIYRKSKWGIEEPLPPSISGLLPDVVLLPLLAVDRKGNRLGYGKGYYDRYFADLTQKSCKPVKIGLAFDFQVVNFVPSVYSQEHKDIPLDGIVTESKVIACREETRDKI